MKKKGIIAAIAIMLASATLTACSLDSILSAIGMSSISQEDAASYYGCPNSKRVKKLNLKKKK